MAGNTRTPGATVAGRVLALLGAFDEAHPSLTLTELAARAGLPAATAHRLLAELETGEAVVRAADARYSIGRRIWDLGLLAREQVGIRQLASPFLNDLYAATRATVHLAERDGTQALYLDRISGNASVPVVSQIGSRLPLHATGVGKVLLAYAPASVQAQVLTSLTRVTPYTITAPGRLREQLRRVLREAYAYTSEEMSLGACSVAVPVSDADGRVIAALGVVVPTLGRDRLRLVAALQVAAQGVNRSITRAGAATSFH
jgi:DNA-binding IclR family transcriptional regulator